MKKCLALLLALLLLMGAVPALAAEGTEEEHPVVTTQVADPEARCKSAILIEADTGDVLYALNPDEHAFPASITKVMTVLLVLEAIDRGELRLDQEVVASNTFGSDLSPDGSTQGIKAGEAMPLKELLYCALVASANEACNILAETAAGDLETFVRRMNDRAQELGMENTHFTNTHGLHVATHYTTARDLSKLVREALTHETFVTIVSTKNHAVPETNLTPERRFSNTNALITANYNGRYTYANAIGVKTGTTPEAGQCLASAAVKSGTTLICIVLGAENVVEEDGEVTRYSFVESKRLLEWGFENFTRKTVLSALAPVKELPVTLSADTSVIAVKPQESLEAILPRDMDPSQFRRIITTYYESVEAPVEAGQILGEITVKNGDTEYGTVKLVAAASAERSELLYRLDRVKQFFRNRWVKLGLIGVAALIVILAVLITVLRSRKKKQDRYGGRRRHYSGRRR